MGVSFLLAGQRWYCSLMVISFSYNRRESQPIISMLRKLVTLPSHPDKQPYNGEALLPDLSVIHNPTANNIYIPKTHFE